jgi:hypothetical protein
MFQLTPCDSVLVSDGVLSKPVLMPITKIDDRTFFSANKTNRALQHILLAGVASVTPKDFQHAITRTTVLETLKKN